MWDLFPLSEHWKKTTAETPTVRKVPGATRQTLELGGSTAGCPDVERVSNNVSTKNIMLSPFHAMNE